MTDKVQKIKEWISKEQDGLMDAQGNFEYPEQEGAFHILSNLDYYIDSLQEEHVSEELEEAAMNYMKSNSLPIWGLYHGFKAGANWQKEQDKQWLAEEHKNIFAKGRDSMKEQMMKEAIEAECFGFQWEQALFSFKLPYNKYLVGSKEKIVLIKED